MDGVLSVHELHIWQLSESKIVASVHVMVSRNHDFMPVAADIRKTLHLNGIHSSTVQPEYHPSPSVIGEDDLKVCHACIVGRFTLREVQSSSDSPCLILCPKDQHCDPLENYCCRKDFQISIMHSFTDSLFSAVTTTTCLNIVELEYLTEPQHHRSHHISGRLRK